MSNVRKGNVIKVDTSATFAENLTVVAIKYMGNTSGTATIKLPDSSGVQVWEADGTSDLWEANHFIRAPKGLAVAVTNGAVIYLYCK